MRAVRPVMVGSCATIFDLLTQITPRYVRLCSFVSSRCGRIAGASRSSRSFRHPSLLRLVMTRLGSFVIILISVASVVGNVPPSWWIHHNEQTTTKKKPWRLSKSTSWDPLVMNTTAWMSISTLIGKSTNCHVEYHTSLCRLFFLSRLHMLAMQSLFTSHGGYNRQKLITPQQRIGWTNLTNSSTTINAPDKHELNTTDWCKDIMMAVNLSILYPALLIEPRKPRMTKPQNYFHWPETRSQMLSLYTMPHSFLG